jgi:hypothetical protein
MISRNDLDACASRKSSNFLRQPFFVPVSTIRLDGVGWITGWLTFRKRPADRRSGRLAERAADRIRSLGHAVRRVGRRTIRVLHRPNARATAPRHQCCDRVASAPQVGRTKGRVPVFYEWCPWRHVPVEVLHDPREMFRIDPQPTANDGFPTRCHPPKERASSPRGSAERVDSIDVPGYSATAV